jgi:5-methylcytosine-specific restriction protein B
MREGDIVATTSQGRLYVGEIAGPPESVSSEDGRSNLRRDVVWVAGEGADYSDLSKELAARLQVQHEVVDLTEQLGELGAWVSNTPVQVR